MVEGLKNILLEFAQINESELNEILKHINIKNFGKGTFFLKKEEAPDRCYFILKGCARQYYFSA